MRWDQCDTLMNVKLRSPSLQVQHTHTQHCGVKKLNEYTKCPAAFVRGQVGQIMADHSVCVFDCCLNVDYKRPFKTLCPVVVQIGWNSVTLKAKLAIKTAEVQHKLSCRGHIRASFPFGPAPRCLSALFGVPK